MNLKSRLAAHLHNWILWVVAVAVLAPMSQAADRKPNVIFVLYDDLGCGLALSVWIEEQKLPPVGQ